MRVLLIESRRFWDASIKAAFEEEGEEVMLFAFPEPVDPKDFITLSQRNRYALAETLQKRNFDVVFALSYIQEVSFFCEMLGILYVCWIFEYPNADLARESRKNACNCFFLSDSARVLALKEQGVRNVFYLPAAAKQAKGRHWEEEEEKNEEPTENEKKTETGEKREEENETQEEPTKEEEKIKPVVSFIGQIPTFAPSSPFGTESLLSPTCRGYLDGLVHCQRVVYGENLLADTIPGEILRELIQRYPLEIPNDAKMSAWEAYVKKFLLGQITRQERLILLQKASGILTAFTGQEKTFSIGYEVQPYPTSKEERETILTSFGIQLILANRFLQNAVPWQVFEAMSYGGLVLMNYQVDMGRHFIEGEDYLFFEDETDLTRKLFLIFRDKKRQQAIGKRAWEKIQKEHLLCHRIRTILELLHTAQEAAPSEENNKE